MKSTGKHACQSECVSCKVVDRILSAALDPAETASAKARIADKLARLRKGEHRT